MDHGSPVPVSRNLSLICLFLSGGLPVCHGAVAPISRIAPFSFLKTYINS